MGTRASSPIAHIQRTLEIICATVTRVRAHKHSTPGLSNTINYVHSRLTTILRVNNHYVGTNTRTRTHMHTHTRTHTHSKLPSQQCVHKCPTWAQSCSLMARIVRDRCVQHYGRAFGRARVRLRMCARAMCTHCELCACRRRCRRPTAHPRPPATALQTSKCECTTCEVYYSADRWRVGCSHNLR